MSTAKVVVLPELLLLDGVVIARLKLLDSLEAVTAGRLVGESVTLRRNFLAN